MNTTRRISRSLFGVRNRVRTKREGRGGGVMFRVAWWEAEQGEGGVIKGGAVNWGFLIDVQVMRPGY